jgi:hypothetical protein
MRRTMGMIVGVGVIAAMTGVAFASTSAGLRAAGGSPVTIGAPHLSTEQIGALRAEAANGPETVGTVDRVARVLDYGAPATSMTLRYPGASYVKVHFSRLRMLPGDYVTIANSKRTESYSYTSPDLGMNNLLGASGGEWGMSVDGDTAVVTLHRTESASVVGVLESLGVVVDEVAHGFTPAQRAAEKDADDAARDKAITAVAAAQGHDPRTESVCGTEDSVDAVCYKSSDPLAYKASKSVVRLLINGTELCTAWRIGTIDRLLTNHHCFTNQAQAENTEAWFNYECVVCGGYETLATTKVWGDHVFATSASLDYTLFSVHNFAQVKKFGYLTIDTSPIKAGEEVYIPQHPEGNPTEIAMSSDQDKGGDCKVVDPKADGYTAGTDVSYYCDTQGGSSGSPVLSRTTNKVIALHHFGGCPNSGVNMSIIYPKIKKYLS